MARALSSAWWGKKGKSISNLGIIAWVQADGLEAEKSSEFLSTLICMQTSWLASQVLV